MVYINKQSEQDKKNQKDKRAPNKMTNLQPIKLVERPTNTALEELNGDQMVHINELALEHF
jgi:hypothetical protein